MTGGPARIRADARTRSGRRKGQAMVETVVVMFVLCLVFFLVYEYANLLTAHTVVNYAAARAARARTVGFNDFMVTKTIRVATAGVAGACRSHDDGGDERDHGGKNRVDSGADGHYPELAADRTGGHKGNDPDPERHLQGVLGDQAGHEYGLERNREQYFLHVEADAADGQFHLHGHALHGHDGNGCHQKHGGQRLDRCE